MNTNLTATLLQISVDPERPPFLDSLIDPIQPYIVALGVALILISAAWAITPRLRQRNNGWPILAGIGVVNLIAAYVI